MENFLTLEKEDTLVVLADWHGSDASFIEYLVGIKSKGIKLIQVVYDMLPIVTPQYSGHSTNMLERYSQQIYPLCDLILSISENTKSDITWWLKSKKLTIPPIKVFRLGDDFERPTSVKPIADLPKKFILCVGTVEARKNHNLLYYSYKLAKTKGINLPVLVIVGRLGWL